MSKFSKVVYVSVISFVVALGGVGCTKKPSQEEASKLDQARASAESAEKKLSELRQERMQLEQDLQGKQTELSNQEKERDDLKAKTNP
jgi:septal ring factor EnvC (AmiA/AmiB activator)